MALGGDLVAVHAHGGGVVGHADRQVGNGLAERVQRQRRDLTRPDGGLGLGNPVGGAQRDVGLVVAGPSTTSAPMHQIPNKTAAVCQCAGNSTATRLAGPAPSSSRNRLPVLAAQLASVTADSSIRSPDASS